MKEKIFKKGLFKRILSLVVTLAMVITLMPFMSLDVYADDAGDRFLAAMSNAGDGDVVIMTEDVVIDRGNSQQGQGERFVIKPNSMVTLDMNGFKISYTGGVAASDVFGVGQGSALLIKDSGSNNGLIDGGFDTGDSDGGTIILNGITVTGDTCLGKTQTWIVNDSRIEHLTTENGTVNKGASTLNPLGASNAWINNYNYPNSAPAMVGSGTTWFVGGSLQEDFGKTAENSSVYNRIIVLKDYNVNEAATLTTSGIRFDLAGYKLQINSPLTIANTSGVNEVRNGTIAGDINVNGNGGTTEFRHLTVSNTVKVENNARLVIYNGIYKNISSNGAAKIEIKDGFFPGDLTGDNYEITGGYFVNKPSENYTNYDIVATSKLENGVTYDYTVVENQHDWGYSKSANGTKLIATCKNNSKHKYELTISVDDQVYSDTATEPTIHYGKDNDEISAWTGAVLVLPGSTNIGAPTITKTYYNRGSDGNKTEPALSGVPTAVGKYYVDVEISYGNEADKKVTVSLPYNITMGTGAAADIDGTTVTPGLGSITISGMKPAQEYIVSTKANISELNEDDWAAAKLVNPTSEDNTKGVVTGLSVGGPYYVYTRTKATPNTNSGTAREVGGPYTTNTSKPEDNKTGYTVDTNDKIQVDNDYEVSSDPDFGSTVNNGDTLTQNTTYYVRKKAKDGAGPSAAESFTYNKLGVPTGLTPVAPQFKGGSDGKITGVTPSMQYFTDGGNSWKDVSGNEIEGLSAGTTVKVRYKGEADTNAGPSTDVEIPDSTLPEEFSDVNVVPASGEDTSDGMITGVTPSMQYSTDGGSTWKEVTGSAITGLPAGKEVKIRLKDEPTIVITVTIGVKRAVSNGGGHVHNFEWGNWNPVSKDENGTKVYQCTTCGYVLEKEYIPAYAYTCLTESERVLKTPQNGSVICDMGRWNAYPRWFFEKLATRPDVNITLKFLYQHKQYTVSIPAGTKIDTECDWYGPLKICSLYKYEVK